MAPRLCNACSSIPADFWCHSHDLKEYVGELSHPLQSFGSMRQEVARGCQLCAILLSPSSFYGVQDIDEYRAKGDKEMLYLRRSIAFPERALALGIGPRGKYGISRTFFSRVPLSWAKPSEGRIVRLEVQDSSVPSHNPTGAGELVNNLDLMNVWLHICCTEHRECSNRQTNFLPTRLLDLKARGIGADVQLVLTRSLETDTNITTRYLTLSHCWGPKHLHSKTTTTRNLANHMKHIPLKNLSRTFQDAVQITRELGQRYLWIDSLCIIQDDTEDWAKEAALMAEVYGNSLCTLAALSSRDGTEGCNRIADIQRSTSNTFIDLNWNRKQYPYIRIFEREPENWHSEYDGGSDGNGNLQSPLRHRAWVLQEKELSRRSIHFGKGQLLWECRETKVTAQLPWEEWKREEDLIYKTEWYELVEDYTLRSMTAATDKLPALSGLAKRHQEGNAQYLAGIWSSQLPGALLWRSTDQLARRLSKVSKDATYIAPTWSWASVQGQISYNSQRLLLPFVTHPDPRDNLSRKWSNKFRSIRLERAITVPSSSSNPYGAIEAAFITLSGAQMIRIDVPPESRDPEEDSEPLKIKDRQIGLLYRDTVDDLVGVKYAFFLSLQDEPQSPLERNNFQSQQAGQMIDMVMGIVLVKDINHTDTYRRIGLARWVDAELLVRSKPQTAKLV